MSRTFDVVIVGTGGVADVQARDIDRLDGRARIVAAVDNDPERVTAFSKRWKVPRHYLNMTDMLDQEHPGLVSLCTPPALHAEQAGLCVERGVNVLCEKPPALSLEEIDSLAAKESSNGGRISAVVQQRFGSGAQTLMSLVGDSRVGRPMVAVCNTLWYRPDAYFEAPWRGKWEVEGGGPTLGHGIHQMDLMLAVLGPWRAVTAVATRQARPTETEDLSAAIVTFENGTVATVVNSLLSPRQTSYLRFDFAHATVELEHLYGYSDDNWRVTAAPGHEQTVADAWEAGPRGVASGHAAQLTKVFDALEAGVAPPVTLADVRPTMELVTAVYASSFTGQPVAAGQIDSSSPFYSRMDGSGVTWATLT